MMWQLTFGLRTPVMKVTALWGDIIINHDCTDNYDSAQVLIRGMDVVLSFFNDIMGPMLQDMGDLFKDIYDL